MLFCPKSFSVPQIYAEVNNGVYKSGFSTTQVAYDEAQNRLFGALDGLEARLQASRFLMGDRFSQADLWLFPTIVRFDAVYAGIFRCSKHLIRTDYPHIEAWMRDVWQMQVPGGKLQVGVLFQGALVDLLYCTGI